MASNQKDVKKGMGWTPSYENKSSTESKTLEEFNAIKAKIESSSLYRSNVTNEEMVENGYWKVISPSKDFIDIEDNGTLFYDMRKVITSDWDPQDIPTVHCYQAISISPKTGNKVEVYEYDGIKNEFTKQTDGYQVSFDVWGELQIQVKSAFRP